MRLRVLPSFVLFATLFLIPLMHADSIVIVGDKLAPDGSFVSVTLVPGVYQLLVGRRYPPLTFLGFSEIFKGPAETTVLTYTLTLANLASPLVQNFPPGGTCAAGDTCILGIGFFVPTTFVPVGGSLTVHFNDETETFIFHYISNAPEPASLFFGTGVLGIAWRKYGTRLRISR